jgi:predicted RND superfamily exporter protein
LTQELEAVPSVTSVESLTEGPKDFQDAEKSPLWKRLLIAEDGHSSNVVVFVSNQESQQLISRIETIVSKFNEKDSHIRIASAPYVAVMIRRNLQHDFLTFSVTSVLLFGVAAWILFRSAKLTMGMLCTCTSAVLTTLLVQSCLVRQLVF